MPHKLEPAQVELDQTLHDLYSLDGGNPNETVHLISLCPHPAGSVSSSLPQSTKYTFQTPAAPKIPKDIWARMTLGNGSQNHLFGFGAVPVYLVDIDATEHDKLNGTVETPPSHQTDAHRTFDCLVPSQRPNLSFLQNPETFKLDDGAKVDAYPPLDFTDEHPTFMSQDVHYGLLSKRDLALSGLPTPHTVVIEGDISPADVSNDNIVEAESQRMIQAVREYPTPFVLKFPQSLAGQGVFVLKNEAAKAKILKLLEIEVPNMIRSLNSANAHLHPVSLLLQDLVNGDTDNLSFFITKTGRCIFMSCAEQFLDEEGIYRSSILNYERQVELEAKFRTTIDKAAAHVSKKGFYGVCGTDIMTDAEGNQYIVDLNCRITGDYFMGPLRGHFYERRGLKYSYIITPLVVLGDRDQFEAKFEKELADGRMIIIGWCRGKSGKEGKFEYSVASVIVGGKEHADLLELVDRINALGLQKPT